MSDSGEVSKSFVSVIVPVYNGGKYLAECLDSIKKQTYTNYECIINNNQSTDNTLLIAEEFAKKDDRFIIHNNQEFEGQAENWNIAISKISGKSNYVKIIPADDWIFPDYLLRMVKLMDKYPQTGICSSYRLDERKIRCDGLDYYNGPVFSGKKILYEQLLQKIEITGSVNTLMFRNSVLQKLPGYPKIFDSKSYHIDTMLAYEVLKLSDLGFVFQVLSFTRRHNETLTSKVSEKYNTSIFFKDFAISESLPIFPELRQYYSKHRMNYAWFLIKRWLARDKECLKWHKRFLIQPIRPSEYAKSIFYRLFFSNRMSKNNNKKS